MYAAVIELRYILIVDQKRRNKVRISRFNISLYRKPRHFFFFFCDVSNYIYKKKIPNYKKREGKLSGHGQICVVVYFSVL